MAGTTEFGLLYLIASWGIVTGIFEFAAAAVTRLEPISKTLLGLNGLASVLLGVLLLMISGGALFTVVWLIGVYANLFGIVLLALGLRVRVSRHLPVHSPA